MRIRARARGGGLSLRRGDPREGERGLRRCFCSSRIRVFCGRPSRM